MSGKARLVPGAIPTLFELPANLKKEVNKKIRLWISNSTF
jgi:hypothetical protein